MSRFPVRHLTQASLRAELEGYERTHGMNSEAFLARWANGELDGPGYVSWAGICRMAIRSGLTARPSGAQVVTGYIVFLLVMAIGWAVVALREPPGFRRGLLSGCALAHLAVAVTIGLTA